MKTEIIAGITYTKPNVTLLHATPLVNAEISSRTCYSSFNQSEHESVRSFNGEPIEDIEHSELLDSLCHVFFHESVVEHINFTYRVQGIGRGVLQQIVRHRIASYSIKSTRYTMQEVLHAFNSCSISKFAVATLDFVELVRPMNITILDGLAETVELKMLFDKLQHQLNLIGSREFVEMTMGRDAQKVYEDRNNYSKPSAMFEALSLCPNKKNVGDNFKGWLVTDSWAVDLVVTFNLRSLKNFFDLRASGFAYHQIQWLAHAMIKQTPEKYLKLIMKQDKIDKICNP